MEESIKDHVWSKQRQSFIDQGLSRGRLHDDQENLEVIQYKLLGIQNGSVGRESNDESWNTLKRKFPSKLIYL